MWFFRRSQTPPGLADDVSAMKKEIKSVQAKLTEQERQLSAAMIEFTEMMQRMARVAKRASGAQGGRPRKDEEDDDQLQIDPAVIDREKRRQRILAMNRRT